MDEILKLLLDDLDRIAESSEEIFDTEVRERMRDAVHHSFIKPKSRYVLSDEFGMFTKRANAKVKAALRRFLDAAKIVAKKEGLATPDARLAAFQNTDLTSGEGNHYDDFFGYAEKP
jgi:hypothetical protein